MRRNYTAECIPYEMEKDRSRAYFTPGTLRELHIRPGARVQVVCGEKRAFLRAVPKFDGDDVAVYLPKEEMVWLGAKNGSSVSVEKDSAVYAPVSSLKVVFSGALRKSTERLEALRLVLGDKAVVCHGMKVLGGTVDLGGREKGMFCVDASTKIGVVSESRGDVLELSQFGKAEESLKAFLAAAHAPARAQKTCKGVLVVGGVGVGKKTLCTYVLEDHGAEWVRVVKAKDLLSSYEYAKLNEPCTLWVDRVDRYMEEPGKLQAILQMEEIMEDIHEHRRRVCLIATCVSATEVPGDLKKAWMLDREVFLSPPTQEQRAEYFLQSLLCPCAKQGAEVESLAKRTAGFSRGNLAVLLRDALASSEEPAQSTEAVAKAGKDAAMDAGEDAVEKGLEGLRLSSKRGDRRCMGLCLERIGHNIVRISPSASNESPTEVPHVPLSAICGQEAAKEMLLETVIWPIKHKAVFSELGLSSPKGLLLYGPPGCGKTLIAQALANESGAMFHSVRGPEIMGKYVGESEERLRQVFHRARAHTPAIVFIDEIDSIAPHREAEGGQVDKRVVSTLLTEMDGVGSGTGVFVLGATNKPWSIDSALLRPGRFEHHVLLGLPEASGRKDLLAKKLRVLPSLAGSSPLLEHLVRATEGLTGAEIVGVTNDILLRVAKHKILTGMEISSAKLKEAIEGAASKCSSRLLQEDIARLAQWGAKQGDKPGI
ncbi:transitional endoplasmic reticulum ATPase [Nematocida sp. AWRm77]|nr:transitional endoplasmic reticulum ATPase [Nematocida sp. AWRm77]